MTYSIRYRGNFLLEGISKINSRDIKNAADILRKGGIVVYPTETVYGLGSDPFNEDACAGIQRMKGRTQPKPMLLLANSIAQIEDMTGPLGEIPEKLARAFWPGPLTMILPLKTNPGINHPVLSEHVTGTRDNPELPKSIAFRITSNPVAAALIEEFGFPVTSTSANLTGQPPIYTYENALEIFGTIADIVIGTDEKLIGTPSTLVDVTSDGLKMIREGSITLSHIQEVL
jgi:L-threonylcarbamoyladenylate synthase